MCSIMPQGFPSCFLAVFTFYLRPFLRLIRFLYAGIHRITERTLSLYPAVFTEIMANIGNVFNKDTGIVASTEIASAFAVSIGAAHFLGETLPHPIEKIKNLIARHIVEPHLEVFERHFGRLLHAEDISLRRGLPHDEKPYKELSRAERVEKIAGVLTRESGVFLTENALMLSLLLPLKKAVHSKIEPTKVVFTGAAVQLGAMTILGTLLAAPTEWMYNKLADILPKVTHMDQRKAKDTARHLTYVGLPGLLGLAAELVVAEREHISRR